MALNQGVYIIPNEGLFDYDMELKGKRVFNIASHGLRNIYFASHGIEEIVAADTSQQQLRLNELINAAIVNLKPSEFVGLFFYDTRQYFMKFKDSLLKGLSSPVEEYDSLFNDLQAFNKRIGDKLSDTQRMQIMHMFYPWLLNGDYKALQQRLQKNPITLIWKDVVDALEGYPDRYFDIIDITNVRDAKLVMLNGNQKCIDDFMDNKAYAEWDQRLAEAVYKKLKTGGLLRETHYIVYDDQPNFMPFIDYWQRRFKGVFNFRPCAPLVLEKEYKGFLEIRTSKH